MKCSLRELEIRLRDRNACGHRDLFYFMLCGAKHFKTRTARYFKFCEAKHFILTRKTSTLSDARFSFLVTPDKIIKRHAVKIGKLNGNPKRKLSLPALIALIYRQLHI